MNYNCVNICVYVCVCVHLFLKSFSEMEIKTVHPEVVRDHIFKIVDI